MFFYHNLMTRLDRRSLPSAAFVVFAPNGGASSHPRDGEASYAPSIVARNQLHYQHTRIPHDRARLETSRRPRIAGHVAQTAAFSRPHGPHPSPWCFLERRECIGRVTLKPADAAPLDRGGARQRVREQHASCIGRDGSMGGRDWLKCASVGTVEPSSAHRDTRTDHRGEQHGRTRGRQ